MSNCKKPVNFNDILVDHLGGFGLWQVTIIFTIASLATFKSSESTIQTLSGHRPLHRCYVPQCDNTTSRNSIFNASWTSDLSLSKISCKIPSKFVDLNQTTSCNVDNIDFESNDFVDCNHWVYDRNIFEETLTTEFDLVCGHNTLVSFLGSIYMIGVFIGSLCGGYINDRFGRKKPYIFGTILSAICYFGASFAPNYIFYTCLRLGSIVSGSIANFGVFTLMLEIVSTKHRRQIGFFRDIAFVTGNALVGIIGYFLRNWRYLQMACSGPLLLAPLLWFIIPDSVSWLVSQDRLDEAVEIVMAASKRNKKSMTRESAQELIQCLSDHIKEEEKNKDESTNFKHIFTNKTSLKNLTIMAANWIGVNVAWYGLAFNHNMLPGNIFVIYELTALADLPAAFACFYSIEKYGRVHTLAGAQILCGLCCLASGFITFPTWLPHAFYFTGKFFSTIGFNLVYVFTAELFPTKTRASCIGFCSAICRVVGLVTPYVQHLKPIWQPLPYIFLAIPPLFGGILVKMVPETRDSGLPETLKQSNALSSDKDETRHQPGPDLLSFDTWRVKPDGQ